MNTIVSRSILALPWVLAVFIFAWLVIQRFPPSGVVVFDIPFDGSSAWMDPFLPAERTTSPGAQPEGWRGQRILQDPVYSAARLPGVYEDVRVTVEFRPIRQPLIELGLLRDEASLSYEFQPLWFGPLEDGWTESEGSGRHGYIRNGESPEILGSSNYQRLALWHASATEAIMSDASAEPVRTDVSLRGSHDFWFLPSGNAIDVSFELQDSNRKQGRETVVFQLWRGGELMRLDAAGIGGSRDMRMGEVFTKSLRWQDLSPGVYRLQFIADDDVFIRSVTTPNRRWVIGPRLSFGDIVGYKDGIQPGLAWTNSRHIVFETLHAEGLQTVQVGDAAIKVQRTHDTYEFDRTDNDIVPQKVVAPAGDIRIIGDGWFALSPDRFFAPEPRRVTASMDPDREGIRAILTPYRRPEPLGDGWYRQTLTFRIDPGSDHMRLSVSAPGLLTRAGAVDIRRVTLEYRRAAVSWEDWWRILRSEAVNAWRRLFIYAT
ncbi:hypothetical protein KJZ71_01745 [Patescibacteria group bacterium]|nr:hypothetical protein [Patescibacteria group bacterium]MDL1952582.1 hypothetical protein [Candidatus Uhrbacteria bacterium UHB]RIL01285.1 MAG: hypothetical protein DCC77_01965 [Candidatus Uhrbacteria bacterium]